MRLRARLLGLAAIGIALLHIFPARKHLAALLLEPSLGESWKGVGALVAIAFLAAPMRLQARAIGELSRRGALIVVMALLAIVHLVPAFDHLPRFLASPTFGDAWRGIGSTLAAFWFATPFRAQARFIRFARA